MGSNKPLVFKLNRPREYDVESDDAISAEGIRMGQPHAVSMTTWISGHSCIAMNQFLQGSQK